MSGNGRRGRRGGRRQRRREEQARQQAGAPPTNGQSGPGHVVLPEPATPAPAADPHPRPLSARELVARLEALRAREEAADAAAAELVVTEPTEAPAEVAPAAPEPQPDAEPRHFLARDTEWIARIAGLGTGGTGRVAPARVSAIRFSTAAQPDTVAAEVIAPHARLDDLYDDELAELLERGLRWTKGNG